MQERALDDGLTMGVGGERAPLALVRKRTSRSRDERSLERVCAPRTRGHGSGFRRRRSLCRWRAHASAPTPAEVYAHTTTGHRCGHGGTDRQSWNPTRTTALHVTHCDLLPGAGSAQTAPNG